MNGMVLTNLAAWAGESNNLGALTGVTKDVTGRFTPVSAFATRRIVLVSYSG